ncbi:MAG: amino acid permease, partial [Actinobacteria bacterium]|nr:amino acid permease [Actinomycetota bacterium]
MSTPETMAEGPAATGESAGGGSLARNKLGVLGITAIVVSAVAPVAVLAAGIPVIFAVQGAATPAMFIIAGVLYSLFAVGYIAMSRHMVNAGGFVAYIDRAFGKRAATAMAMVTLLFYFASIVAFYAISGAVAAGTIGDGSLSVPLVTFAFLIVVAVLGVFGVSVNARLLVILLTIETVAVIILDVALAMKGGPEGYSFAGFAPSAVLGAGFGVGLLLAMVCYSGLEA